MNEKLQESNQQDQNRFIKSEKNSNKDILFLVLIRESIVVVVGFDENKVIGWIS